MKRFLASIVFLLITFSCFSQDLNNYKYVVVPYKFDFLKKHDKYRVNTLLRHLFKKEGFQVVYDNEDFPKDLADDRCKGLYADLDDQSSIFTIKIAIVLRDCSNQIVMETTPGRSKIKAYEKGYNEAIRRTFQDIKAKKYSYEPKVEEIVEVEEIKEIEEVVETPVVKEKMTVAKKKTETVVEEIVEEKTTITATKNTVLYAQPIENGYQLVDSTPKVVMILLKTGVPNVYLVKGQDASVYKENGKWMLSKATNSGTKVSALNIKF